jgi:hypothetical protein
MVESDITALGDLSNRAYVYVISAGPEKVKVGKANNPQQRMRDLQTGHYETLSLFHSVDCAIDEVMAAEHMAHALLREKRLRGEWFSVTPNEAREAVEKALDAVRRGIEPPEVVKVQVIKKQWRRPALEEGFHPPFSKDLPTDNDMAFLRVVLALAQNKWVMNNQSRHCGFRVSTINACLEETNIGIPLTTFESFGEAVSRIIRFWINYSSWPDSDKYCNYCLYPQTKIFSSAVLDWPEGIFSYSVDCIPAHIMTENGDESFFEFMQGRLAEAKELQLKLRDRAG